MAIFKKIVPLAALILIVAGFIAYANSFDASFHWDDGPQIMNNAKVHELSTFADPATWTMVNWRPFSLFTLSLNWAAGGTNVLGYHLINLLLHILTAFIVFLLARFTIGLLATDKRLDQRYKDVISLFVALLFLLHPLQTMAVTYIIQRMTILAALFYFLSVLLYAKGRIAYLSNGLNGKSLGLLLLAFLMGIMGVLSKQNAVTFPAAFILYELFFIRKPNGQLCKKYIISGAGILLSGFLIVLFAGLLPAETSNFSRMEYLSAQFGVFYKYILLVLIPVSQNADYYIQIEPPLWGFAQFVGIGLVLGLIALGVYLFKRNKLVSFGIFWIILTMSVESGLIPIRDIMMEHRMYLPMFGVGMIMAGIVMRYVRYSSSNLVYVAGIGLFIILAFATYQRNKVWKTGLTLWQDCLDKNPENPRALGNLGFAVKVSADYAATNQLRTQALYQSIELLTASMQTDTIFTQSYMNRSLVFLELGEYEKAIRDISVVAKTKPKQAYLKTYIEGVILAKQGQLDAALKNFNSVVKSKSEFAPAYKWRGLVYAERGEYESAIGNYRISLRYDPSQLNLYIPISDLYVQVSKYGFALEWLKKAQDAGLTVIQGNIDRLEKIIKDQKQNK